jgi:hypothetical protein
MPRTAPSYDQDQPPVPELPKNYGLQRKTLAAKSNIFEFQQKTDRDDFRIVVAQSQAQGTDL